MNIIQDIIEKNVTISVEDFAERETLKELVQNQRDKLEEVSKDLDLQKDLYRQCQRKYTVYNKNLENQFFSIILKVFKETYLGAYFKEISSRNHYNYFINIKNILDDYASQGYVSFKSTTLRVQSSNLYFEEREFKFYDVAELKEFFDKYILIQEPELTKIATYMLLSSNLISECK